ncbi:MAG: hypothetical protein ACYS83_03220 [Planctomycetota bacterium]|jgi:hypothetical protein
MSAESGLIIVLVVVNVAAGLGFAIPIARGLGEINNKQEKVFRYVLMLVGVYFAECVAFSAGMATQVFSVSLAFVWGAILGLWLRNRSSADKVLKSTFLWALYTCLPTVSFCVVIPAAMGLYGWAILSGTDGVRFGVPEFLPWPLNTILGFCAALLTGTVVLKTVITTGEVGLLIRFGEKSASGGC